MHRQHGLALITTMVVVTVVTLAAVSLAAQQRLEIRKLDNMFAFAAGDLELDHAEYASRALLLNDLETSAYDSLDEPWAGPLSSQRLPQGRVTSQLYDLNGRFNLNNLTLVRPVVSPNPSSVGHDGVVPNAAAPESPRTSRPRPSSAAQRTAVVPQQTPRLRDAGLSPQAPSSAAGTRDRLVEDLSRVYTSACAKRGRSVEDCGDPFATNVNRQLANDAVDHAIEQQSDASDASPASMPEARTATTGTVTTESFAPDEYQVAPPVSPTSAGSEVSGAVNVVDAAATQLWLLLAALDIDTGIAQAILDWVDADSETRYPNGAEDDYYLALDPPYRSANRNFADVRELRLVRGIDAEILKRLVAYITLLPTATPINVNTASAEVLMSLAPGISRPLALQIIAMRRTQPFQSIAQFNEFLAAAGYPIADDLTAVRSDYFEFSGSFRGDRLTFGSRALLHRAQDAVTALRRDRVYFP